MRDHQDNAANERQERQPSTDERGDEEHGDEDGEKLFAGIHGDCPLERARAWFAALTRQDFA
jgi:hypothetical protein